MSNGHKNLYSGIFFIFFSAFLFIESFNIKMSTADALGPQFFPRLVAFLMLVLALVLIFLSVKNWNQAKAEEAAMPAEKRKITFNFPLVASIVLLFGYFLVLEHLGFMISTAIYLFCQMFLLLPQGSFKKPRYLVIVTLVSVGLSVFIYYLFLLAFSIFLPAGILG